MPAGDSETGRHTFKPKALRYDVSVPATFPLGPGKCFQFLERGHGAFQPRFPSVLRCFGLPASSLKGKSTFENYPRYDWRKALKRKTLLA